MELLDKFTNEFFNAIGTQDFAYGIIIIYAIYRAMKLRKELNL